MLRLIIQYRNCIQNVFPAPILPLSDVVCWCSSLGMAVGVNRPSVPVSCRERGWNQLCLDIAMPLSYRNSILISDMLYVAVTGRK